MKKYSLLLIWIIFALIIGEIFYNLLHGAGILISIYWTFSWIAYLWNIRIPILLGYGLINLLIYGLLGKVIHTDKNKKYLYYALIIISFLFSITMTHVMAINNTSMF